jgi:hypothetical protein
MLTGRQAHRHNLWLEGVRLQVSQLHYSDGTGEGGLPQLLNGLLQCRGSLAMLP